MQSADRIAPWPLIGRETELGAFRQVLAGRQRWGFFIHGPAGTGKSRLAEECLARAQAQGMRVGRATATNAARSVPLGAIAHLLPPGVNLSEPVAGFRAVARALAHDKRPWALLIDDLHLLDGTSAVLVRQLVDAGAVRLIVTVRAGEPLSDAAVALMQGDTVHRVDLADLDRQTTAQLLQSRLGGTVGQRTVHELFTASGGNVLFLHELVHGALTSSDLTRDCEVWELTDRGAAGSPRLTELIEARLAAVGEDARPVLELLALCEELALADAEAMSGLGVLADLEASRILEVMTAHRRTAVRLAHPLYGEVIRARIPHVRRRDLLLEQAERVERHGARRRDDALRIATWRLAATGTADPALLLQAATLAQYAHDHDRIVELLTALPTEYHDSVTLSALGEAHHERAEHERAEEVFAQAAAVAATEKERLYVALLRMYNLWCVGDGQSALSIGGAVRHEVTDPAVAGMLDLHEGSLRVFDGDPRAGLRFLSATDDLPPGRVLFAAKLGQVIALHSVGKINESIALAVNFYEAQQRRTEGETPGPFVEPISYALSLSLGDLGRLDDAERVALRGVEASIRANAPIAQALCTFALARRHWFAGRPADARRAYAEALTLARKYRPVIIRVCAAGLAACAAVLGDLDGAESALGSLDAKADCGIVEAEVALGPAWLLAARGRLGEARSLLAKAASAERANGRVVGELRLLTDMARLGGAKDVADRVKEVAALCDGPFAAACADLVQALAQRSPEALLSVGRVLEDMGADLLAAEAHFSAAATWGEGGNARGAAAAAHSAQACAARCQGARTPLLVTTRTNASLTKREEEIALLAASGLSSRAIAETLTVSVRTVDNHLQHAYQKLGVTSRTALAEKIAEVSEPPELSVGAGVTPY
ncbi:LuxR C-terminal-related transcriptional regulator [Streptomyces sp. Lzd4kr]|nr:LuxR C-terminal-related transcriptional regulator [Streptomyces sp. Lzd4kr]